MALPGEDARPELGAAGILAAVVFLAVQIGLPLLGLKPNFLSALVVWLFITAALSYVAWFFPWKTPGLNKWVRVMIAIIGVGAFVRPHLAVLWANEHKPPPASTPASTKPSLPPQETNGDSLKAEARIEHYPDGKTELLISVTNTGVKGNLCVNNARLFCDGKLQGIADDESTDLNVWIGPGEKVKQAVAYFIVPGGDRNAVINPEVCRGALSVKLETSRGTVVTAKVKK